MSDQIESHSIQDRVRIVSPATFVRTSMEVAQDEEQNERPDDGHHESSGMQRPLPDGLPDQAAYESANERSGHSNNGCHEPAMCSAPGMRKRATTPTINPTISIQRIRINPIKSRHRSSVDLRTRLAHDLRPAILFQMEESAEFSR